MIGYLLLAFFLYAILSPGPKRKTREQCHNERLARRMVKRAEYAERPEVKKRSEAAAERRATKERNRDRRGVAWALVAGGLASQTEADGATILALRRDASLSQDPERLHAAALQVLRAATNES